MIDFTLKNTVLQKKIKKQTLTSQIDIVKIETDITTINTLF